MEFTLSFVLLWVGITLLVIIGILLAKKLARELNNGKQAQPKPKMRPLNVYGDSK